MELELRDLRYFLACVDTRGVSAAARALHVAQPTISHALARLEARVSEPLLLRTPGAPLRLTEAGEVLAQRARAALSALAAVDDDLSELRGGLRGEVRVAAVPSLCASLLPRVLAQFRQSYPGVSVSVQAIAGERIARLLQRRRADLGLIAGRRGIEHAQLSVQALYRERFVLVAQRRSALGKRRSLALHELRALPLVLAPPGTFSYEIFAEACRQAGFVPKLALSLASTEARRECTRQGLGCAVVPEGCVAPGDAELVSVALIEPTPEREIMLARSAPHEAAQRAPALRFVDTLCAVTRDLVGR